MANVERTGDNHFPGNNLHDVFYRGGGTFYRDCILWTMKRAPGWENDDLDYTPSHRHKG
jgi:hypothetical protein